MSSVITLTNPSPPAEERPRVLTLHVPSLDSLLDRLAGILENFSSWNDQLSYDLYEWGRNVLLMSEMIEEENLQEFKVNAQDQLNTLENQVLVDPFTQCPYESPVLVGNLTWDERVIEHYLIDCETNASSPFSEKPVEIQVHQFAVEMIRWLKDVRGTQEFQKNNEQLIEVAKANDASKTLFFQLSDLRYPPGERQMIWYFLISQARAIQNSKMTQKLFMRQEDLLKKNEAEMRKATEQKEGEFKKRLEETKEQINDRLDGIQKNTQQKVGSLEAQLNLVKKENKQNEATIDYQNKVMEEKGNKIRALERSEAAHLREIARLRDEVGKGGGCSIL